MPQVKGDVHEQNVGTMALEVTENDEYFVVESMEESFQQLLRLETILLAPDSHNIKRLVLETTHWLPENLKCLERILQRYTFDSVQFRMMYDEQAIATLGKTTRLELFYCPLVPFLPAMEASHHLVELVVSSTLSVLAMTVFAEFLSGPVCRLSSLDLTGSRFIGHAATTLADGFRNHRGSLSTICLSECNLVDEQISALMDGLVASASIHQETFDLQELDLSFNKGRHRSVASLSLLLQMSKLRKLSLGFQAFGEAQQIDLTLVMDAVANNSCLTHLEIGGNSLCDPDMQLLVEALTRNNSIEILDVSGNRFTNDGISLLADNFGNIIKLKQLHMEDIRDIDDQCIAVMATALELSGNNVLHTIEVDEKLQQNTAWSLVTFYLDLNWGGSRQLLPKWSRSHVCEASPLVPLSVWPLVLYRVNFPDRHGMTTRVPHSPSILYHLIREVLFMVIQGHR